MVARINPTKSRLYPEIVPEAQAITSSASGVSIASYANFKPYTLSLQEIYSSVTPNVTLRVDNDSGHGVIESILTNRPPRIPVPNDVMSYDSLDLWGIGTGAEAYITYLLKVLKMSVFEKIKYGLSLEENEVALANQFDIQKKIQAGVLQKGQILQPFKKVIEVAKSVTVAAGGSTRVGRVVNIKYGQKAVLLGISVDSAAVSTKYGGPGSTDTYFVVNRDTVDSSLVKLDCVAMPDYTIEVPCYIPAVDKHEITIESTTGITNLGVRYRYGISDVSIIEKLRWDIDLTVEEKAISDSLGLEDSVLAGVM